MSFNYQVVRYRNDSAVTIGEVYYNRNNETVGYALLDDLVCDSVKELRWLLQELLHATDKGVIKEEDLIK